MAGGAGVSVEKWQRHGTVIGPRPPQPLRHRIRFAARMNRKGANLSAGPQQAERRCVAGLPCNYMPRTDRRSGQPEVSGFRWYGLVDKSVNAPRRSQPQMPTGLPDLRLQSSWIESPSGVSSREFFGETKRTPGELRCKKVRHNELLQRTQTHRHIGVYRFHLPRIRSVAISGCSFDNCTNCQGQPYAAAQHAFGYMEACTVRVTSMGAAQSPPYNLRHLATCPAGADLRLPALSAETEIESCASGIAGWWYFSGCSCCG